MKTYEGAKRLKAKPMTRGEFIRYKGQEKAYIPEGSNLSDEGYLVEYEKGGKPNHPDHEGYISWSPKEIFEETYQISESFSDRMHIELVALNDKVRKLMEFRRSKKFSELSTEEAFLLGMQATAMERYSDILADRLVIALAD